MLPDDIPQPLEDLLQSTRNMREALDLKAYLQTLSELAAHLTASEGASILVPNETGTALHFLAAPRLQREVLRSLDVPMTGSAAGRVFASAVAEIIHAGSSTDHLFTQVDEMTGVVTRNMMVIPLRFNGQTLGVLEVINRKGGADYTPEDVTILEVLAVQAAMLLYNDSLQKKLDKAQSESALLDRMKNDFIAISSHELRTPLGLILGHATFLRELVEPKFYEQLDTIIRSATRLKSIIENLSSVDNFQNGMASLRSRMVSIKRLVEDTVAGFQPEAALHGIRLRTDLGPAELWVDGDAEKLGLALGNLVKNALQFTEPGGIIVVSAENVPGYVKISVVDNGIGIPSTDLTHIFERFYQVQSHLTRTHGGMGLGLSVTKAMVELHGGRVWAESMEGKGSTFTILLPLNFAQNAAAQRVFTP